jgi:hypothetical protein
MEEGMWPQWGKLTASSLPSEPLSCPSRIRRQAAAGSWTRVPVRAVPGHGLNENSRRTCDAPTPEEERPQRIDQPVAQREVRAR